MRRIAVVSVGRSDWGHLAPVIEALGEGAFPVGYNGLGYKDDPHSVSQRMGDAVQMYADLWDGEHPDLILLFGDRYEQLAAAMASLPFAIPLAHLHGGETTVGAFDNQIRHALTKMAHLHLVSHRRHGARVHRMGEDRWRIHVTGAPGLDRLRGVSGMRRVRPIVLLTLHPCTLEYEDTELVVDATLAALGSISGDHDFMVTAPNADTFGGVIAKRLRDWIAVTPGAQWVEPTDEEYVFLMASAAVMVGNSSSGILEAPSFSLPVVNIGRRQHGRLRGDNVIDVGTSAAEIAVGINLALDPTFRAGLSGVNPYGDGHAAPRIAEILRTVPLDRRLLEKR